MAKGSLEEFTMRTVAAARANPARAAEIYLGAAQRLIRASHSPENVRYALMMRSIAREFADHIMHPATVDDFDELTDRHAQAYEEAKGGGDLEVEARKRELREAEDPIPRVSIAPDSFSERAQLGRVATVKYAPSAEDTQNNITQQAQLLEWPGRTREEQSFTIDIGVINYPPVTADLSCRPFALIQTGAGGAILDPVKIDVGIGTRITGAGSYVSVIVGMDPPATGKSAGAMTIGAGLGLFAAPSQSPVQLTVYVDDLAAMTSSDLIPRPSRAKAILPIQMTSTGGATASLIQLDSAGTVIARLPFSNGAIVAPIPLLGPTFYLRIDNTDTLDCSYGLPFLISL